MASRTTAHQRPPFLVRTADALTLGLVLVAAAAALHPFDVRVMALDIRVHQWARPALLAVAVAGIRHWMYSRPTLWTRLAARLRVAFGGGVPDAGASGWKARLPWMVALGIPAVISAGIVAYGYDGVTYLRGDCPYYFWTARALFYNHGLDLSRQLPGGWQAHINQVSWSIQNVPVPKHPVVLPILSLPFIIALGKPGALVFNLVQMFALVLILYGLARLVARPWAASAAVAATFAFSFLPDYVWNYSPDLCATVLLMGGTLLLARDEGLLGNIVGGALVGAACVAKFPLVLFIPGSLLLVESWKMRAAVAAGLILPLSGFALMNAHLFGSPITTSYDRIVTLTGGRPTTYSQRSSFDLPFLDGLRGQLFEAKHGLLPTSPITLIALLGVPFALTKRWRLAAHLTVSSLALFLLFSTYDQWNASHYGNRFLMPLIAAFVVPLAAGVDRVADRLVRRRPLAVREAL